MITAITFITDVRPGEPDILSDLADKELIITDIDSVEVTRISPPPSGGTHELLEQHSEHEHGGPLDAYLGSDWVGSSEV